VKFNFDCFNFLFVGKTQLINHFRINDSWYLVDLPGYGYVWLYFLILMLCYRFGIKLELVTNVFDMNILVWFANIVYEF
jgi:hypothetical protein